MWDKWNSYGFQLSFSGFLIILLEVQQCVSLNQEGLVLLEFRASVDIDPYRALESWDSKDVHPCKWFGVYCTDGKVHILDLSGFYLEGILAPELGKLSHLRSLVLYKNRFSGAIPKEFEGLQMLELLDLRQNNLTGTIPSELGEMMSLKRLLLSGNNFHGRFPPKLEKLNSLAELQLDLNLPDMDCGSRKAAYGGGFGVSYSNGKGHDTTDSNLSTNSAERSGAEDVLTNMVRRTLFEVSSNLHAAPVNGGTDTSQEMAPVTLTSGSFPAVTKRSSPPPAHSSSSSIWTTLQQLSWKTYLTIAICIVCILLVGSMLCIFCKKGTSVRPPWESGLSGQLQKALVTGVPKLNRAELEIACEEFSNVIDTLAGCIVYKGTLSSGVEIAVASTKVSSHRNWSKRAEKAFREKLDVLSRVNHKNFVNLLGYCNEDKPFMRMMVFEYAPNGTLYEHLHVKEAEILDWNNRVRIIMGIAYCLEYMHHEMNPPLTHPNLQSSSILLTDDYAAKIAEIGFWTDIMTKSKMCDEEDSEQSLLHHDPALSENVYKFGVLLLEIICGKLPYNEEGSLLKWAAEYWNDSRRISYMVDPKLKSFRNNELDMICEVIQECINPEPNERPTMQDITCKLRKVIPISPDTATPKLSPIWWAELEILSTEAS